MVFGAAKRWAAARTHSAATIAPSSVQQESAASHTVPRRRRESTTAGGLHALSDRRRKRSIHWRVCAAGTALRLASYWLRGVAEGLPMGAFRMRHWMAIPRRESSPFFHFLLFVGGHSAAPHRG